MPTLTAFFRHLKHTGLNFKTGLLFRPKEEHSRAVMLAQVVSFELPGHREVTVTQYGESLYA